MTFANGEYPNLGFEASLRAAREAEFERAALHPLVEAILPKALQMARPPKLTLLQEGRKYNVAELASLTETEDVLKWLVLNDLLHLEWDYRAGKNRGVAVFEVPYLNIVEQQWYLVGFLVKWVPYYVIKNKETKATLERKIVPADEAKSIEMLRAIIHKYNSKGILLKFEKEVMGFSTETDSEFGSAVPEVQLTIPQEVAVVLSVIADYLRRTQKMTELSFRQRLMQNPDLMDEIFFPKGNPDQTQTVSIADRSLLQQRLQQGEAAKSEYAQEVKKVVIDGGDAQELLEVVIDVDNPHQLTTEEHEAVSGDSSD